MPSTLTGKVARSSLWAAVGTAGSQVLSVATYAAMARLLGPELFGHVALADVLLLLLGSCTDLGFSAALVQRSDPDPSRLSTAFWTNVSLGAAFALLMVVAAAPLCGLIGVPDLAPVMQVLALRLILAAGGRTHAAMLRRQLRFGVLAAGSLMSTLAGGAAGLVVAALGGGIWSLVSFRLVDALIASTVYCLAGGWCPAWHWSRRAFHELLAFGKPVVGIRLLEFGQVRADQLVTGFVLGPLSLGYYALSLRIVSSVGEFVYGGVMNAVAFPALSAARRRAGRFGNVVERAVALNALVSVPAFALLMVLAPLLVAPVLGAKWGPAAELLPLLCLAGMVNSVSAIVGPVLQATGFPVLAFRLNLAFAAVALAAYALGASCGLMGLAAARGLVAVLMVPIQLVAMCRVIAVRPMALLRHYLAPLAAAAAASAVMLLANRAPHPFHPVAHAVLVLLPCGAATYLVGVRLLRPRLWRDAVQLAALAVRRGER